MHPSRRTPLRVYAADGKQVFSVDGPVDRRVGDLAMREFGDEEGRAMRRRDTCIVGIAVLSANAVDALAFVPTQ